MLALDPPVVFENEVQVMVGGSFQIVTIPSGLVVQVSSGQLQNSTC